MREKCGNKERRRIECKNYFQVFKLVAWPLLLPQLVAGAVAASLKDRVWHFL